MTENAMNYKQRVSNRLAVLGPTNKTRLDTESIVAEADAELAKLRADLLDIADAARLSPYREANQWDDSLAKLIARKTDLLKA